MFRIISITLFAMGTAATLFGADGPMMVRRDTEIPVEVRSKIKSESAKVGDTVEFRTTIAVLIGKNVVVPENSEVLGTVVDVQHNGTDGPRSLVRIRIHTLRWKSGETALNAIVASVRHGHIDVPDWGFGPQPTFMEGIRIVSYQRHEACTDFSSAQKNFTVRSGVSLMLRQIDPAAYPDRDFNVYTPDDQRTAKNYVHN